MTDSKTCSNTRRLSQWHGLPICVVVFVTCVVLTGCGVLPSGIRAPNGIDLSGQWHLNENQSDSLEKLLASVKDELDPPTGRRGFEAGGSDTARIRGRRDEFYGPPRTRELISLLAQPADFTLTQSARDLTMKSTDGTKLYVFGEESVVSVTDGLGDQRCGWTGDKFAVGIRAVDGRRIEHQFGLTLDRLYLQVTTNVSGGGLPSVKMKRVYDRVTPGK